MRKLFGWMAGLAGVAALARLLSARKARHEAPPPGKGPDPADALRRKLSESRTEQPADDGSAETMEERRARIHAKAHETIASMQELEPPS